MVIKLQDDVISKPISIDELIRRAVKLANIQCEKDWSNEHAATPLGSGESTGVVVGEGSQKNSIAKY